MPHPTAPKFDPVNLLAPKSKAAKSQPSSTADADTNHDASAEGQGNLIEKFHKVEKRQERPTKRQKQSSESQNEEELVEVKEKQEFNGVTSSGAMGQYLKEKREEASLGSSNAVEPVDLTMENSEDEDNDLVITKDYGSEEVCLGRVEDATVNAHKVPTPRSLLGGNPAMKIWAAMAVTLHRRPGSNNIIAVADPKGNDFGYLDARVATALCPLMDGSKSTNLRLQARLDARQKKPFEYPGQQISGSFAVTINMYAQRKFVKGLGIWLSQRQIWLREPLAVDRDTCVINPHRMTSMDTTASTRSRITKGESGSTVVYAARTHEEVRNDVLRVFDTIKDSKDWPEMQAPKPILTDLLPHQKQAIYFLNKREQLPLLTGDGTTLTLQDDDDNDENSKPSNSEEGAIWQKKIRPDGRTKWVNAITGHKMQTEPPPVLGGILADVMGLGKTLNILSLVVGSLNHARQWQRERKQIRHDSIENEAGPELISSIATLLVCPLSTIVNWEEQIKTHIKGGTLKYCIYQGQGRTNDPEELKEHELIITTYQTVGNEYARSFRNRPNKPLFEIEWFRVVLDEAHQIRNTSAVMSKAACELKAPRRWCVTGTPVQNRLDDLGALIKFLQIKPFDEQGNFSRFISAPLRTGNAETIPKLRILVDLITLRRLKDKLNLPGRKDQIVYLDMSEAERSLYDQFSLDTVRKVNAMAGSKRALGGRSYAQVLKAVCRLRMLCAHGADMLSDDDWAFAQGFDPSHAIDLEDEDDSKPDKTPSQAFEMFRLMKDANVAFCAKCNTVIEPHQEFEELDEGEDEVLGFLTPCNQLLCSACVKSWRKEMAGVVGPDNRGECTICDAYIRLTTFEIRQRAMVEDSKSQEKLSATKFAKNLARYSGPHTKTKILLRNLEENARWSRDHPDERPIKSVVFSEWTTHLDLIQLAFTNAKIDFTRLDGSTSFKKRTQALNTFETSSNINVILISLKAGGLGLNLTAASHVFVMEPNYNPQAELQAIERVHRLGQKRDVTIHHFIMKKSIEEKVLVLQEKKRKLASFSVDRDDNAGKSTKEKSKQTLEEIKDLLR